MSSRGAEPPPASRGVAPLAGALATLALPAVFRGGLRRRPPRGSGRGSATTRILSRIAGRCPARGGARYARAPRRVLEGGSDAAPLADPGVAPPRPGSSPPCSRVICLRRSPVGHRPPRPGSSPHVAGRKCAGGGLQPRGGAESACAGVTGPLPRRAPRSGWPGTRRGLARPGHELASNRRGPAASRARLSRCSSSATRLGGRLRPASTSGPGRSPGHPALDRRGPPATPTAWRLIPCALDDARSTNGSG